MIYTVSENFPYGIYLPCIYRIRSLVHCVTNISYWLPLNEGFKCNRIKTNKYIFCVVCKWFICVAITIFGDLWNVTLVKSLNQHLETNLLGSINCLLYIVYWKKKGRYLYYRPCIEYTRFPRDHFKPIKFLEVCKK